MTAGDGQKASVRRGKIRFERHSSQVVFDPATSDFVVTWTKCGIPDSERLAAKRDPGKWMPSVSAVCTLFDRGCIPQNRIVYAARAIGRAWNAGDRDSLDTEEAKKAAELVADLSSMCVDPESESVAMDIGQAMRHLIDEMAAVRFAGVPCEKFSESAVMPTLEKAAEECFGVDGFESWPAVAKRRRFMFCLNKRERSEVKYTLISLLFDTGSCPLLSLSDRRMLRMRAMREANVVDRLTPESMCSFFRHALSVMRGVKDAGLSRIGGVMSQQQLVDCLSAADSPHEILTCCKHDNHEKKHQKGIKQ